jgi:hypothetical protein
MKKFLAVAAILVVSSAHAEELKFGDLNYFLKQGQLNAGVDVIVNNENSRTAKTVDVEVNNYLFNTRFGYALTDTLNLTLGLDYLAKGETEADAGASADDSGLQNPKLGANYRVLNQNDFGYNFDVGAVAAIKIVDRESGSVDDEGNNTNPLYSNYAEPRSSLDLNARFGKKWNEANEFYLIGGVVYHMDGEYDDLSSDETVDMDSSMDLKLGAFYQYRPVHEFMLTVGALATRVGEVDGNDGSEDFTVTDRMDTQFSFNAKYLITENFIAKFLFTVDRRDDFDYEQNSGDVEVDKRLAEQYGVGVDFLF